MKFKQQANRQYCQKQDQPTVVQDERLSAGLLFGDYLSYLVIAAIFMPLRNFPQVSAITTEA